MEFNPAETYLQEADELLASVEQAALQLEAGGGQGEAIDSLFRAFHTIKGSGAMSGFDRVAAFTHHVESLLARLREGSVAVSSELGGLVLKCADYIRELLGQGPGGAAEFEGTGASLIGLIAQYAGDGGTPAVAGVAPVCAAADPAGTTLADWEIVFRPGPQLLMRGGNPAALIQELRKLGTCAVVMESGDVPALEEIEPEHCYLWWRIQLQTACDEDTIRDVFIFVEDDSKIGIRRLAGPPTAVAAPSPAAPPPATPAAGGTAQAAPQGQHLAREATVRVPSQRLDRLVNLVGELVMNRSRLAQAAAQYGAVELANPVQELERLVAELRDNVLGIRMLPIGTLFGRFRRLVHDLAKDLGKEVDLVTEGAGTELDKSILDQLGEPMVHCLRNALDHGVEAPAVREAAGKPKRAVVRLSAVHTGSDVVVSIEDDGCGIDREAVRAKAIERKLIAPGATVSDKEIFNLILLPGFSTSKQVTNVSGRGVGMDAVKKQIDALRGTLSIASEVGKGTRFSITLPLTLAIIEGLLVQIGGDQFIVPMAAVTENVELSATERAGKNRRNVIAVRGELVPYIDLRAMFSIAGQAPDLQKTVIVQHEGDRIGLVVDRVLGTHQTVIQSLGKLYRDIEVVSGATIMGDGRVALILDVPAVVRHANRECGTGSQAA
jgi:two-component system, chemotaxis family, sensor kinase CheA